MSTTSDQNTAVECRYPGCDAVGRKWEFEEFCTTKCETKHEGYRTLASIRFDHCICATCFTDLKTTNPPKPDFEFVENGHGWTRDRDGTVRLQFYSQEETRRAATGFQFLTPSAGKGEKQARATDGVRDRVITGTICDDCGNTDHTHHDPALATRSAIGRLVTRLDGRDDLVVDAEQLHRVYDRTGDLDLAVGESLDS